MINQKIYQYAQNLSQAFQDNVTHKLPIKLSFKIHKNKELLTDLAMDIEKSVMALYDRYGIQKEDGVLIPPENVEHFRQEYNDLMEIEQTVNILTVKIDELSDSIEISNQEMEAILFMIEE